MEEIKIGEYVRYKDGTISKVLDVNKDETFDLLCENFTLSSKFVVKHSKNIIDLIEEGDIVEIEDGKYEVVYDESYEKLGILIPSKNQLAIRHSSLELIFQKYKSIRIVTKEKFENECFRVEGQ